MTRQVSNVFPSHVFVMPEAAGDEEAEADSPDMEPGTEMDQGERWM